MPLLPMNDTIFGRPIMVQGKHSDLIEEFARLTADVDLGSIGNSEALSKDGALIASLDSAEQQFYTMDVIAVGPDVQELSIGDTVIVPPDAGTMVTIVEEDQEYVRLFLIEESACLARYDDA